MRNNTIQHGALSNLDFWTKHRLRTAGVILLMGFSCPLLKHSLLFGSQWVWPWHLLGFNRSAAVHAAMAAVSGEGQVALWSLVPLFAGITSLYVVRVPFRARGPIVIIVSTLFLSLLLVVFSDGGQILGLAFLPQRLPGGIAVCIAILGAALIAGANHLGRALQRHSLIRLLLGIGGVLLGLPAVLMAFVTAVSLRTSWPMLLACAGMIAYSAMAVYGALRLFGHEALHNRISVLGRVLLLGVPIACFLTLASGNDPFVKYVVQGGGTVPHIFLSVVKCSLIYIPITVMLSVGIALTGVAQQGE